MAETTTTRVTMRLPAPLVRAAKHYAVDHDADFQDVVAEALALFLKTKTQGKGGKK
jgi:predicted DNA binding CopG/RHH family protein